MYKQKELKERRVELQAKYGQEFIPKDYFTEGFARTDEDGEPPKPEPGKDDKDNKLWKLSTIADIGKTILVLGVGLIPFPVSLMFHAIFNEIIVGQAIFQASLMILPFLVSQFVTKVDFPVLYSKELRFVKTQVGSK